MAHDSKSKMSKESSKHSKRAQELASRRRSNNHSDSDESNSSDSESEEMDVLEYRKFLSKIFPSKNLSKKIKAGEKIKKMLREEDDEDDDDDESVWEECDDEEDEDEDEEEDETPKKSKKISKKSKKKRYESDDEEEEEEDEKEVTRKHVNKKKNKNVKNNKSKKSKRRNESEDEITIGSEDSESDEEEEEDEVKEKPSGKFNIIFTIGGAEDEEESDEYDSDYEDEEESDENTEDEDESVSSDEDYEEDDDDESANDNKILTRKQQKELELKKQNKEKEKTKDKIKASGSKSNSKKQEIEKEQELANNSNKSSSENDQLIVQLKELLEKNSSNETIKKCLDVCESDIKNKKAKEEKKTKKQKAKNARIFKKIIKDKNTMNDYTFFEKMETEEQKKIIKELKEINKITRIEKPYRMTLLESNIPTLFKGAAMKKINSLRYMEPGSGEFYKIKNWVDTFMRIPFNEYKSLPLTISDGLDKCHEFMENAQKTLDDAVYGLNDAKMQIMQMLGQLVTNPTALGTAIAIHGPPGTGKTSLVKEGISKILNRPFAFIALGGATDSSFLEGHSYTYEGSMWGKIVQILIDSKCMNPVIYFDELDKISDTPKGEEIAGILTHLTDTSQNSQYHDKYFAEIDFDLSKCLFIFSYNDESKVNPILKDRMYRIQTKGYNQKQKTCISNNYLLPKIREQVKFNSEEIIIPTETLHYIIDNLCNKEDGVRNLKRCLEIIHTKLNLYRLMKPNTNLFEEEMSLKVEFPFTVTKDVVDKFIKIEKDKFSALHSMYI